MKITVSHTPQTVSADQMEIGQVARVSETDRFYAGEIILRTYSGIVSLTDPNHTWNSGGPREVEILPPGTTVTLTTEN